MANEREQGKIFSEKVDRLISGQEVKPDALADTDLRSALDFARKMTVLRDAPSPQFSAQLKEKLMRNLEKQETGAFGKEKRDWFSWFNLPKPVWQAAAAVFVIMVVVGISWAAGVFDTGRVPVVSLPVPSSTAGTVPAATTAAATMPATAKPLTTTASATPAATQPSSTPAPTFITGNLLAAGAAANKTVYASGEEVRIDISLKNISPQTIKLEGLPPIVSLMQTDTHRPVYTFREGKDSRTLAPEETASYSLIWNQFDFNNRQVSTGNYYVELEDLDYQGKAVQLNLSRPVTFTILPADAMTSVNNTLQVDQSQNAGGITVMLQKVELFNSGIKIYAFASPPPDYTLIQGATALIPSRDYTGQANFAINGGWMQDAGSSSITCYSNGMNFSWYLALDDSTSARDLVFVINRIGIWTGPWQFNVALK